MNLIHETKDNAIEMLIYFIDKQHRVMEVHFHFSYSWLIAS